jgi:hypothetical protein
MQVKRHLPPSVARATVRRDGRHARVATMRLLECHPPSPTLRTRTPFDSGGASDGELSDLGRTGMNTRTDVPHIRRALRRDGSVATSPRSDA